MALDNTYFETRIARDAVDLQGAKRLRYRVFIEELGGNGDLVDHAARMETDEFDEVVDHLVLIDTRRDPDALDHVVGAYRLLPGDRAERFGRFYSDGEYDLSRLRQSGRPLLELGRSCIDAEYRRGTGMYLLWNALSEYVFERDIELLFGVASFHGTDIDALRQPLSWLHHHHLAPAELRPVARESGYQAMALIEKDDLVRREAMLAMPPLIKAYLRLGGAVGDGAFLDRAFNTTDVLLLIDTEQMSGKHRDFYAARWQKKG